MLLTLRIPLVDLRQFVLDDFDDLRRLPPAWTEDKDFVRSFGPVTRRLRGPSEQWPSERVFGRFDHLLRFPANFPTELGKSSGNEVRFFKIARRLYPATVRDELFHLDIQIAGKTEWWSRGEVQTANNYDLPRVVQALLLTQVSIDGHSGRPRTTTTLDRAGQQLARIFEQATMAAPATGAVVAGSPAVVVEVRAEEDPGTRWHQLHEIDSELTLCGEPKTSTRLRAPVWMVNRFGYDSRRSRELRVHLLRLHSERELLRQLIELLREQTFLTRLSELRSNRLQEATNQVLKSLTRWRTAGFENRDIMKVAFASDRIATAQEYEVLVERLEDLRRTLTVRVREFQKVEAVVTKVFPLGGSQR